MTTHAHSFYVSSARGSFVRCTCGWEAPLPDIKLSPLHEIPTATFLRAGFEAGRLFEQHEELPPLEDRYTDETHPLAGHAPECVKGRCFCAHGS